MNREIKRTERDSSVTRQFYDSEGQLIKVIRPNEYQRAGDNGKGLQYTYDARGNILTVVRPDGIIQESNLYDAEGNLIHTHDGTGKGVDIEYDIGGRRTKIMTKGKASQQYVYDAPGNITGITDGEGNHRTGCAGKLTAMGLRQHMFITSMEILQNAEHEKPMEQNFQSVMNIPQKVS